MSFIFDIQWLTKCLSPICSIMYTAISYYIRRFSTSAIAMPDLPKLTSLHVSSAKSIPEDQISIDLPTTMAYDQPIIIHAQPKTDMWRQPPNTDRNNAPTRLISTPIGIHRFRSARVTVSANWNTLYDQGGLILFIPGEDTTIWMKTGIEFFKEKLFVASVATSQWSDWAIEQLGKEKGGKVTIQVEREVNEGEKMDSLWVYTVDEETGRKTEIRQITWWFACDILNQKISKETSDNRCLLIGVYAARPVVPAGEGREHEELVVKFERFEVKLFDD
jgi:regulation of enolase protein 1 (concanavalin A-like superfamily)